MEEADQLCSRVAIMDHGRILALDTPTALKSTIGADTEVRVAAEGDLGALVPKLEAMPGVTHVQLGDGWVRVYLRGGTTGPVDVLAATDANGYKVTDVGIAEPTLETVFINLTGKDLRE